MIIQAAQQQQLARELSRLVHYGRTEVEFEETGRSVAPPIGAVRRPSYGNVVLKQWGWTPGGWKLRESVRIGCRGKITRTVHDV